MNQLIAQCDPFGCVEPPGPIQNIGGGQIGGVAILLNIIMRTLVVGAAIYAVINIILAGYAYISAGGDVKRIQEATARIWQSILGITVAAGALIIVGIISEILFGDWQIILGIKLFTP